MIRQSGSVQLIGTRDGPRIVTIKENIQKVKNRLPRKQKVSARKLWRELGISVTSVRRILKIDLGLSSYEKIIKSSLSVSDDQKIKRKQFSSSLRTNFAKRRHLKNSVF